MRKFLAKLWRWLWWIDPVVEPSEYQADDPHDLHDPERITRLQFDDDFRLFERTDK